MLRSIILFILIYWVPSIMAQNLDFKIYTPELKPDLVDIASDDLSLKVASIFSQQGVYNSNSSAIGIYPTLLLLRKQSFQGLQRKETVQLTFGLVTKNSITGEIFYTYTEQLAGIAPTKQAAIVNAIQNININAPVYAQMLQEIQTKISSYYEDNCSRILANATKAETQNDFEKAISLLNAVPQNSSCYAQAQEAQLATYLRYQKNSCDQFVQNAQIAITQEKFDTAIDWLGKIDVAAPCFEAAKKLLVTAAEGIDQQNQAKLEFLNKVYQNKIKLETSRNKAIEQISSEYLKKN